MKYNYFTEKHHSVVKANEITEICKPLFTRYGINNFIYARIFDDHRVQVLVTNAEQQIHHFKHKHLIAPYIPNDIFEEKFDYFMTSNERGPFQQVLNDIRNEFHFWYPLFSIERYYGFYDLYLFFSSPDNHNIINLYINNMNIFNNFKFYFKEKAAKLLIEAEKNIILLPEQMRSPFGGLQKHTNCSPSEDKQQFLDEISVRKYIFNFKNKKIYITKREKDCLKSLSHGYTVKDIAKSMNISPRTAEEYLDKLKSKLDVKRKSEILDIISEYKFKFP